jgi:aminopeptidase C
MLALCYKYVANHSPRLGEADVSANVLRYDIINQLNLGEFQLSQSYLFFYDKLEKANYYLE